MAWSLIQSPDLWQPANNPMVVSLTDSGYASGDYYTTKIYSAENGVYTLIVELSTARRPDAYILNNLSAILRNQLSYDIVQGETGFVKNDNSGIIYYFDIVRYTSAGIVDEQYTTAAPFAFSGTTDNALRTWNAALDFADFKAFTYSDYYCTASTINWLTNWSEIRHIQTNQCAWLHFNIETNSTATIASKLQIKTYNSAGTLIQTATIDNSYAAITKGQTAGRFMRVGVGSYQLNNSTLSSGSQPLITSSVAYYTVTLTNGAGTPLQANKEIRFNIDSDCYKGTTYRLHWLNRKGGFDSFNFRGASVKTLSANRTIYKKPLGSVTSGVWDYNYYDRQEIPLTVSGKERYSVDSYWISEAEAQSLQELITSPVVFWEVASSRLYAVTIGNTEYEVKQERKDKLINFNIEFTPSYNYTSQQF